VAFGAFWLARGIVIGHRKRHPHVASDEQKDPPSSD